LIERSAAINTTDQYGNSARALCRLGTERSNALCDLLDGMARRLWAMGDEVQLNQ